MKKKAFSLFELILVVVLIGLVYSIVLGRINNKKEVRIDSLKNLKYTLSQNNPNHKKFELIVYGDKCQNFTLKGIEKELKLNPSIFENIKVYKVKNGNLERVDFPPYIKDDEIYDVCLRFKIFPNGSSSSYIIEKDEKYYIFNPYFLSTKVTNEKDEAINIYTQKELLDEYKSYF